MCLKGGNKNIMKKIKEISLILMQAILIAGITIIGVIPFSCKVTTEGIEIIGGNYSSPKLEDISVIDEKKVQITFSEEIKLNDVVVSPFLPGISDSGITSKNQMLSPALQSAAGENGFISAFIEYSEDNKTAVINLEEPTKIGKTYEVFGVVEDRIGNTLTFCIPFVGYNSFVPKLIMTEAQIKYGKGSSGGNTIYRGEYIEFLALEDGNLAGLEIISGADGEKKKYDFPSVDVCQGEIILVHFRTVAEGCVNEVGDDLNLATAPHSANGIRDLWSESTVAHFNDSSDVIILRNTVDGSIMDALMYAADDAEEWKTGVADYAVEVGMSGIYNSYDISNACSSKGCTTLKSITRIDSLDVLHMVINEEDYEYPFVNDEENWCVMPVSPGIIE